jgi:hypothetical protein
LNEFRILHDKKEVHRFQCAYADLEHNILVWFHKNNYGCSADWSLKHEGYSVVDESGKRVDWVAQQVKGASNE